ncbi:MAG: DNA polymerase III subunit alpha, partial [Thermoanaerobaculia bacterium]
MPPFVHLHLHSEYSMLDGANRLHDVLDGAKSAGMPAMALTDHGNLFGAIEFYNAASKAGIQPILGIEAYVAPGRYSDRDPGQRAANHLVLLVRNEQGYRNLLQLTTRSFLEGFYYKPRVDRHLLRSHAEGLVCLSACLKGEINERLVTGREAEAERTAREYLELFGEGNFYLELQDHGIPAQRQANEGLRRIARRLGVPLVATNDCHYLRADDATAHDVLLCIGTQKTLADPERLRYASDQFYLKSGEEMAALFPDVPEAIENSLRIAEQCRLELPRGTQLPAFPVPSGHTLESFFVAVTRDGLDERLAELPATGAGERLPDELYRERLEQEIAVIQRMEFAGYFLIVWDFIRHARECHIPVGPGRGSAAGSLVAWSLRITDIDPLRYGLVFERFLNPERVSLPDIDIDFCMRRRGEVIQYVSEKYGRDRVAQIITFGTLGAKAVIRDVGRVLGLPYGKVDRIAKLIPDMTKSVQEAVESVPALRDEAAADAEVAQVLARELTRKGIEVRTRTRFVELKVLGDEVRVTLEREGSQTQLEADQVLLAMGRRARSQDLGLEELGIGLDARGFVEVGPNLRTRVPTVSAVGDVVGGPLLAHLAVVELLAGVERPPVDARRIPACVYAQPQVAWIGWSEMEARERWG